MLLPEDASDPPFTDEDLEAYFYEVDTDIKLSSEDAGLSPSPVHAWSVCDTGSAEWAFRRLAHAEALIEDRRAAAKEFKAQIDRWLKSEIARPLRSVTFFTGQLEAYARRRREEEGEKTTTVPSGKVTSRRNPARLEVTDDQAVVAFRDFLPDAAVKAKWSPVVDELKKAVLFKTVWVPDYSTDELELVPWPDADGAVTALVALPRSIPAETLAQWRTIPASDLTDFHDEVWPICDGQRVPGVVQVPAEVTYTVKAERP